jgi:hypothetical protein
MTAEYVAQYQRKTRYNGPAWASVWGVSGAPVSSADMSASPAAVTDSPGTGKKIVVDDIIVSGAANLRLTFTCETTGAVIAYARVAANGQVQLTPGNKLKLATAAKKLMCQASGAGAVEVLVGYHVEA